jgi:hypothetical protein
MGGIINGTQLRGRTPSSGVKNVLQKHRLRGETPMALQRATLVKNARDIATPKEAVLALITEKSQSPATL